MIFTILIAFIFILDAARTWPPLIKIENISRHNLRRLKSWNKLNINIFLEKKKSKNRHKININNETDKSARKKERGPGAENR